MLRAEVLHSAAYAQHSQQLVCQVCIRRSSFSSRSAALQSLNEASDEGSENTTWHQDLGNPIPHSHQTMSIRTFLESDRTGYDLVCC